MEQIKKKTRGRPKNTNTIINSNTINSNNNNSNNNNNTLFESGTTNETIVPVEENIIIPVPIELQNSSIDIIGYENTMKLIEITSNNVFEFCNYLKIFQMYRKVKPDEPIPSKWFRDDYWMYSLDERIQMLNEAFELQDDEAVLKNVQPGDYKCTACGCNRILLELRQIRSADEPMTQFFKCANCKKSWTRH